jgi:hypothetical protein
MDRAGIDQIVERLRRGGSVALVADRDGAARRRLLSTVERELSGLGRTVLWIDLTGAQSGAELGGRIVEACLPELDHDELGDLLERLPSRGRLDLEAFGELLMLPETVAATGKRAVAILDGFETVEKVIGFGGLGVVRDALVMRERVGYLFVGSGRLDGLFGRPNMPLYGLAEVVRIGWPEEPRRGRERAEAPPPTDAAAQDPLAAALLGWADAPPKPKPEDDRLVIAREMPSAAELAWERFMERERRRDRGGWGFDEDDDPWGRRIRRRRR